MRITLLRTGGFTGQQLVAALDTDEHAEAQVPGSPLAAAAATIADLAARPAEQNDFDPTAPGASQPRYQLTVSEVPAGHQQDPSHQLPEPSTQVINLTESQIPQELRPLITELLTRARPAGDGGRPPEDGHEAG